MLASSIPPRSKVSHSEGFVVFFFLEAGPHPSPPRPITPINQPKVGTSHLIFRLRIHGRYGSFLTMMVPS